MWAKIAEALRFVEKGRVDHNPALGLPPFKLPRQMTKIPECACKEIDKILSDNDCCAQNPPLPHQNSYFCDFAAWM